MPKTNTRKNKEITIHDIAQTSGVSAATVSRVLSKSNYPVNPDVRTRVLQAAEKLNYKPSLIYRSAKNSEKEMPF